MAWRNQIDHTHSGYTVAIVNGRSLNQAQFGELLESSGFPDEAIASAITVGNYIMLDTPDYNPQD